MALIKWFDELSINDIALVGGKNASLGEMISKLKSALVPVPFGFALTTTAYVEFLKNNALVEKIFSILEKIDPQNIKQLEEQSLQIRELILQANFDQSAVEQLYKAYEQLKNNRSSFRVAVRSSASLEDLPHASFAGQQDTYLHVASFDECMKRIKDVYASLFGARAIAYRAHNGFNHKDVLISVGIQEMVNSDEGVSGVMFSIDPETGFNDAIFINASYGLGESVVSGAVNPDEFMIYKKALKEKQLLLLNRKLGSKKSRLKRSAQGLITEQVDEKDASKFCLDDDELFLLGTMALAIEHHYRRPMDIEWAKDGITNQLFILQARPETVHSNRSSSTHESFYLKGSGPLLCSGRAVGKKIGQGKARLLKSVHEATNFLPGEILVTDMTDPNWEPVMQKASAIVTNRGGRTCHAAIIARELGIAAIVGTDNATEKISNNSAITVSCAEGDTGNVYEGLLEIGTNTVSTRLSTSETQLPLMLIVANPQKALSYHALPHRGIGLARLEFIIANTIGIHPNAILQWQKMPAEIQQSIFTRSAQFSSPKDFYVDTLTQGISTLAAVAHPHPIIVRLSDFKTNEYEELLGGALFESKENNPMIGFRGASRYISPQFQEAFELECRALKKAREQGFSNIQVMVPFVRTLKEAEEVIALLAKNGLKRGPELKIIMMCEVPSNVMLAEEFLHYFDGFSIGSNDLTQLCLGIDRDAHLIASQFKESDPAVLKMIEIAISACKKNGKYVGICGQGPSDDLHFARWLLDHGIDSISLSPDTFAETFHALSSER